MRIEVNNNCADLFSSKLYFHIKINAKQKSKFPIENRRQKVLRVLKGIRKDELSQRTRILPSPAIFQLQVYFRLKVLNVRYEGRNPRKNKDVIGFCSLRFSTFFLLNGGTGL
jgi:hypothetical protein